MTYADRLAEFVKVTGHKPGEMNVVIEERWHIGADGSPDFHSISIKPPAQSAGPWRCNRYVRRYVSNGSMQMTDPKPCVLDDGHEGAHEP